MLPEAQREAAAMIGHLFPAVALNVVRLAVWFAGQRPAQTRHAAFAKLTPAA